MYGVYQGGHFSILFRSDYLQPYHHRKDLLRLIFSKVPFFASCFRILSVFRAHFSCSIFCIRQSYFITVPHKSIKFNSDWGPSALDRKVSTALIPYFDTHHHSHILTHTHILTYAHTHAVFTYCNDILATPRTTASNQKPKLPPLQ